MPRGKEEKKEKPKIQLTGVAFTAEEQALLRRLSDDATDMIGRRVSGSSVLRAIIRYLGAQGLPFARDNVFPLIEKELSLLRWGRKKES